MAGQKNRNTSIAAPLLPLQLFAALAPYLTGLFYEWQSALASLFLLAYLLFCHRRRGCLCLRKNSTLSALLLLEAFMLLGALWGTDTGASVFGFVKFLPLPLFALCLMQLEPDERPRVLAFLPASAAGMLVLSLGLGQLPALRDFFYVNSRLAGFFGYPNVFAAYCLLAILFMVPRLGEKKWYWPCAACAAAGIALSGSRTTFILFVAAVVCCLILYKERKTRVILGGGLVAFLCVTLLYALLTGNFSSIGRYLTGSLSSSTLLGRLLYDWDALPMILRHPLGLGYLGYWYTQGSFQTGVYSVMNVHNELFQLLLDVGWIPTAAILWAFGKSLLSERMDRSGRLMLIFAFLHSMLDFDFQFVAYACLLLPLMETGEPVPARPSRTMCAIIAGLLACVALYFGGTTALYYGGYTDAALRLWPSYTQASLVKLQQADSVEEMEGRAQTILKTNASVSLAWSARARCAYASGDFGTMISCKKEAIRLARYSLEEYLDYFDMLEVGIALYTQAGDAEGAEICREHLLAIPSMLQAVLEDTSSLAWQIDDKPALELPAEYEARLEAIA